MIVSFLQLNLCITQKQLVKHFTEDIRIIGTFTVPFLTGFLTQVCLFCCASSAIVYAYAKYSLTMKIAAIIMIGFFMILVAGYQISWEASVGKLMEERARELPAKWEHDGLFIFLDGLGLDHYAGIVLFSV